MKSILGERLYTLQSAFDNFFNYYFFNLTADNGPVFVGISCIISNYMLTINNKNDCYQWKKIGLMIYYTYQRFIETYDPCGVDTYHNLCYVTRN